MANDDRETTVAVADNPGDAPTRRRATRLEDIAARVGISSSEVSRVLNGRVREGRSVGRAKQEMIWSVAREMGYQPNRAARSLANGRTDTAGLLVKLDSQAELSPHYHEIIGALTYTLAEWGFNLLVVQSDEDATVALEKLARARACDGVLLTDLMTDDNRPGLLENMGLPFVIRGSAPRPGLPAVGMDNAAIGYRAVEFLRRLGHRHILFQNIGQSFMSGKGRYEGFQRAVEEFGLRETTRYEDTLYKEEELYDLTRRVMAEPEPPTAIFAADEMAACGVLRALADLGLRVPEDVSVLTCLNARFMRRVHPRLSVLNTRQHEVAAEAGRTLARLLRGHPVEPRQVFLAPVLEENGSCAPPLRG
jgi:DNA-binding LacI/PurR family transcriptional regulator